MSHEIQVRENIIVGLTNASGFELAQRAAKMLSMSSLVPTDYQGPTGLPNCIIALNMASRMGADPLMVMQNLVVVHGRPTWSSQFLIATFNSCGRFSSMRYEFFGEQNTDSWGCRAVAIEKETGQKLSGTDVTIAIAKAEGWYSRNGSKWKTIPQQMLTYRAACWFVRAYAPELSMGLHSAEEVIDIADYKDVTPKRSAAGKNIDDLLSAVTGPSEIMPVITDIDEMTSIVTVPNSTQDAMENDEYADLRLAIRECESLSNIAQLMQQMSPKAKTDMKAAIAKRQNEIKLLQEAA